MLPIVRKVFLRLKKLRRRFNLMNWKPEATGCVSIGNSSSSNLKQQPLLVSWGNAASPPDPDKKEQEISGSLVWTGNPQHEGNSRKVKAADDLETPTAAQL